MGATEVFVKDFLVEKIRLSKSDEAAMGHPPAIESVVAVAKAYKERGIPVAIATSGLRDLVMSHLHHAGLDDLVVPEHMVFAADVEKGKPDPAIYLEAAKRIG